MSALDVPNFSSDHSGRNFDLLERSTKFSKQVVLFARKVPSDTVNDRLVMQLVDAATSVGANYHEADDASSPRDYRHKVCICRKESMFWLHMIAASNPDLRDQAAGLWREAKELNLIFGKIVRVCDANAKTKPHAKPTQRPA